MPTPTRSFHTNLTLGTQSLLRLAASTERHAKIIFCSSIATVSNSIEPSRQKVSERLPHSVESAAPMGYARAKWVAEHMCDQAARTPTLRGRVAIARIGQLCGDTRNGIWNEKEGWPLLIATSRYTGCLPMLDEVGERDYVILMSALIHWIAGILASS